MALLCATTPGSTANEGELRIPQSSRITGTSQSDCFVSYQDTRWGECLTPSAEKQSMYSTAAVDLAMNR